MLPKSGQKNKHSTIQPSSMNGTLPNLKKQSNQLKIIHPQTFMLQLVVSFHMVLNVLIWGWDNVVEEKKSQTPLTNTQYLEIYLSLCHKSKEIRSNSLVYHHKIKSELIWTYKDFEM